MTTPPSDESADATTPLSRPDAPPPGAETPPPPPPAAAAPAAPPPGPPMGADPGYAFAPVARPPRVPWVNPARRAHVVGVAAAGALVLLGAGIGIGFAASGDGHHRGGIYRMELRPGFRQLEEPPGRVIYRIPPRFPGSRQFPTAPAATPSPSATK